MLKIRVNQQPYSYCPFLWQTIPEGQLNAYVKCKLTMQLLPKTTGDDLRCSGRVIHDAVMHYNTFDWLLFMIDRCDVYNKANL